MSYVKAVFDFPATEGDDLAFSQGEVLVWIKDIDDNWAHGCLNGKARDSNRKPFLMV